MTFSRHAELVSASHSFGTPLFHYLSPEKVYAQVLPLGVTLGNEVNLPLTVPVFELLLPCDGFSDTGGNLIVDQLLQVIAFRKAFYKALFVLVYSALQVVGHSNVKNLVAFISENVNVVLSLSRHGFYDSNREWQKKDPEKTDILGS